MEEQVRWEAAQRPAADQVHVEDSDFSPGGCAGENRWTHEGLAEAITRLGVVVAKL